MTKQTVTISEKTLKLLEWDSIKEKLKALCGTEPGRSIVDNLTPLEHTIIIRQIKKITSIKELYIKGHAPDLDGLKDITPFITMACKGMTLSLENLIIIKNFVAASNRIYNYLKEHKIEYPNLEEELSKLDNLREFGSLINASITEEGDINEKKYPELKRIKKTIFSKKQEIEKKIHTLMQGKEANTVFQEKIHTTRNDRFVVLVKANMKHKCRGTVHDVSSSGSTFYIEPSSIVTLNNSIITLNIELNRVIEEILGRLSYEVAAFSQPLLNNLDILAYIDFLTAAARLSKLMDCTEVEVVETPGIDLIQARHPVLYLMDPGSVIANDIKLGITYNGLIISGANTGGKTVLLKTIGLAVIMTLYGLHLAAHPDSKIGIFTSILVDIGDDQNITQSLSTFSGQLAEINTMLQLADERSLVIIDEIMVGTNPRQGASLAQAILEQLILKNCKIIVTTHYSELKDLATTHEMFENASVMFDIKQLKPTYQLNIGLPGISYGIEIAQKYNLPQKIIKRSIELLDSRELSSDALIEKIQHLEQEIQQERQKLHEEREKLEEQAKTLKDRLNSIEQERNKRKEQKGLEFLNELNAYRKEVSEKIHSLQTANIQETGDLQQSLINMEKSITEKLAENKKGTLANRYFPFDAENAKPGDPVYIIPLEQKGTIETFNASRTRVTVRIGASIKSQFRPDDLLTPEQGSQGRQRQKKQKTISLEPAVENNNNIPVTVQTSYNTIDLRGMRVTEAIARLESGIHAMSQNNISTIIVIHGHGTGALKDAVRSHLKQSLHIKLFRPGNHGEGGDGVTIIQPY